MAPSILGARVIEGRLQKPSAGAVILRHAQRADGCVEREMSGHDSAVIHVKPCGVFENRQHDNATGIRVLNESNGQLAVIQQGKVGTASIADEARCSGLVVDVVYYERFGELVTTSISGLAFDDLSSLAFRELASKRPKVGEWDRPLCDGLRADRIHNDHEAGDLLHGTKLTVRRVPCHVDTVALSWTNTRTTAYGDCVRIHPASEFTVSTRICTSATGCIVAKRKERLELALPSVATRRRGRAAFFAARIVVLITQSGRERPQTLFPSSVLESVPGSLTSRLRVICARGVRRDPDHDRIITRTILTLCSAPSMPRYHARIPNENVISFRH